MDMSASIRITVFALPAFLLKKVPIEKCGVDCLDEVIKGWIIVWVDKINISILNIFL